MTEAETSIVQQTTDEVQEVFTTSTMFARHVLEHLVTQALDRDDQTTADILKIAMDYGFVVTRAPTEEELAEWKASDPSADETTLTIYSVNDALIAVSDILFEANEGTNDDVQV